MSPSVREVPIPLYVWFCANGSSLGCGPFGEERMLKKNTRRRRDSGKKKKTIPQTGKDNKSTKDRRSG